MTDGYSQAQRRAFNIIWTTAGQYDFDPGFIARNTDGSIDFYMNCIIGFIVRYYGVNYIPDLFSNWSGNPRQSMYDDIAWLALENAAYTLAQEDRPILSELRTEHANEFFAGEHTLSRQQWMAKNQLVYTLQSARWANVLGRRKYLSPHSAEFSSELSVDGHCTPEELSDRILTILSHYTAFDPNVRLRHSLTLHISDRAAVFLSKFVKTEMIRTDILNVSSFGNIMPENAVIAAKGPRNVTIRASQALKDKKYIVSCFGSCIIDDTTLNRLEHRFCIGDHEGNHLWYCKAQGLSDSGTDERLINEAAGQYDLNRRDFHRNIRLYSSLQHRLTAQITNCLLMYCKTEQDNVRAGTLNPQRVWREPALNDDRVFTGRIDEAIPDFCIDILIDSSASRLHCQEVMSAQGYILAKSLEDCKIPVRVSCFCSLRGYTVLRILKDRNEKAGEDNMFRYFASGWNRDGLALRAMKAFFEKEPDEKHILIVITDASPNDSTRIPSNEKHLLSQDYGGKAAVRDTAEVVHELRADGIRVCAIFTGNTSEASDAKLIYGKNMIHIDHMDMLANAAGRMIEDQIRESTI